MSFPFTHTRMVKITNKGVFRVKLHDAGDHKHEPTRQRNEIKIVEKTPDCRMLIAVDTMATTDTLPYEQN